MAINYRSICFITLVVNYRGNLNPIISRVKNTVVNYNRKLPWYIKFDT
jgi:hypothetical protein